MKKVLLLSLLLLSLVGCNKKESIHEAEISAEEMTCLDPMCSVTFQPYGNISQKEVQKYAKEFEERITALTCVVITDMKILPNKSLNSDLLNDHKNRYSASKILNTQHPNKHEVIIGITNVDITHKTSTNTDWGIQGLALLGKKSCTISTFRIRDKADVWKVISHEFVHAFNNWPHCPNNDPTCIMCDAKGKPNWKIKNSFCKRCRI